MDIVIVIIKSIAVAFFVIAPVSIVINGIAGFAKESRRFNDNFNEWSAELELYVEALNRGDTEAANVHDENMKRLNDCL